MWIPTLHDMHVVTHDDVMNSEDGDVMLKYIVSQECEEQVYH